MLQAHKCFKIRQFDPIKDYATIEAWWKARDMEAIPLAALSRDGYFVTHDGEPILAAWLYVNNSSDVAKASHLIGSPKANSIQAHATDELVEFLQQQAQDIGKFLDVEFGDHTEALAQFGMIGHGDIDRAEFEMVMRMQEVDLPLVHRFTPAGNGWLYSRQIHMPARSIVTTKIHKVEHPFIISKGDATIYVPGTNPVRLKAPYTGITKAGTRRIFFVHDDLILTTTHYVETQDIEEIERTVTDIPENSLIGRGGVCLTS